MKVLVSGLAVAAIWLSAGATQAAAPPRALPAAQDKPAEATALQAWLAATTRWTESYGVLTSQMVETLTWLINGSDTLISKLQNGGSRAATAWAEHWSGEARARLAADMAAYVALPTQAPPFPANVRATPELRQRVEVVSQTSDQVGRMVLSQQHASNNYIAAIQAAASGHDDDIKALEAARIGLLISQLEAEITMIQASATGLAGPNQYFAQSQIAANRAMIAWLGRNQLLFSGQPVDSRAAARDVSAQAVEVRRAVARMRASIIEVRQRFRSQPGFVETPFGSLLMQALVTLDQSADVEERLASALDQLAVAVTSDDEKADDDVGLAIEALINERVAIDAARRQMIAQSGG
jgi:hypothetical protein